MNPTVDTLVESVRPFSNFLPAATVLLLAAGALERDGLFFIGGCVSFAVTAACFLLLALGGAHAVDKLRLALTGLRDGARQCRAFVCAAPASSGRHSRFFSSLARFFCIVQSP